jgi:hypothetical protein
MQERELRQTEALLRQITATVEKIGRPREQPMPSSTNPRSNRSRALALQ